MPFINTKLQLDVVDLSKKYVHRCGSGEGNLIFELLFFIIAENLNNSGDSLL